MPNREYVPGELLRCDLEFAPTEPVPTKDASGVATQVLPDGYIVGTASTPSVDSMGHQVLAGAFDESIRRKGLVGPKGIKLLAYHRWNQPAGVIKHLETIDGKLKIAAELNLGISYVKDLHEAAKQNGGLNFSVGFRLQDFKFAEKDDREILVIEKGDLMEVSVVVFPAQEEATMEFVKSADSPSEFEKRLIEHGWAISRNHAKQLMQLCRDSIHLLTPPVPAKREANPARPMLDAHQLKAASDLTARVKSVLSGVAR